MKEFTFYSKNEDETKEFGKALAAFAKKGDVFALFGTLGMGKSVLARAFIQNFIGDSEVPSPTFTLLQTYEAPDFEIFHFDLYRIKSAEEIFELGMEDALQGGVCLIEWPEKMGAYLPKNVFKLEIAPFSNGRRIVVSTRDEAKQKRLSGLEV